MCEWYIKGGYSLLYKFLMRDNQLTRRVAIIKKLNIEVRP